MSKSQRKKGKFIFRETGSSIKGDCKRGTRKFTIFGQGVKRSLLIREIVTFSNNIIRDGD
jgi:hypothetical protein